MTGQAVLLDKDGTLIEDVPMNVDPKKIRLMPGADTALKRLADAGFRIAVVSNQPGVALGYFSEDALVAVDHRLRELLQTHGVPLAGFYYCPHHPDGTIPSYRGLCDCRKPAPGLIHRAATALGVHVTNLWMVGDILDDIEAAHRAGCRGILFDSGGETEWLESPLRIPDFITSDFAEVTDIILAESVVTI